MEIYRGSNDQYENYLRHILANGVPKTDRTGTGTLSTFGYQMRFDLSEGFPLVTTKKVYTRAIIVELLWFLLGRTDVAWLQERKCNIWNEWADQNGELGPVYGKQWRSWEGAGGETIDQISNVISEIKTNPDSRRHIVSAWNVADLEKMALVPCHAMFQFYVANNKLSCLLFQRSCDSFLGVPFNIASYSLLTHLVAEQCGLGVGDFIWTGGDCHIYNNHFAQVKEQLTRDIRLFPKLVIKRKPPTLFEYNVDDFAFDGYDPHPAIKGDVAV